MSLTEAQKYHAYARECLQMAETTDKADIREKLIELSRVWMKAALTEEQYADKAASGRQAVDDFGAVMRAVQRMASGRGGFLLRLGCAQYALAPDFHH